MLVNRSQWNVRVDKELRAVVEAKGKILGLDNTQIVESAVQEWLIKNRERPVKSWLPPNARESHLLECLLRLLHAEGPLSRALAKQASDLLQTWETQVENRERSNSG